MRIAQRYLDEIEQICEGDGSDAGDAGDLVYSHWGYPEDYGGLFNCCGPINIIHHCGCPTQIRGPLHSKAFTDELTFEIAADDRLAESPHCILPEHLRTRTYPLTDSQKQEVRECLYPYAEWQTRLRLEFQDAPGIEAEIVEVGT